MAVTTDAVLADTVPTVLESARFTEQFIAEMSALVWNIRKALHDGKNVNLPYWGVVTATNLAEGVDMVASETMSDTLVTVTPAEVGCKLIITDKVQRDDNEDVKAAAGRILGNAMETKRDIDLLALFGSAATTIGGAGACTLGQIAASRAILRGNPVATNGPAPLPYVCVLHPYVALDIVDVMTPIVPAATVAGTVGMQSASLDMQNEVIRTYGIGRLFGMPIIEDGNIATTANSADGCIFASGEGGAIVLATANEWGVEPERDASLRATELNIVGEYGVGWYLNRWGVTQHNDATLPA